MINPRFYVPFLSLRGKLVPETHRKRRRGTFELLVMIVEPIPIFMPTSDFRYKDRYNRSDDPYNKREESKREMTAAKRHGLTPPNFR
jgi:hypothetical protein